MVDKWTVIERFQSGPKMKRKDWLLIVYRKASELVKEYGIKYKPSAATEELQETAEKVWGTGLKLASDLGCYEFETGRIAKFSEDEIIRYFKYLPNELWIGEGKDRRQMQRRRIDGFEPCLIGGGGQVPCSFDIAPILFRAIASLPFVDWIETFNLPYIGPWGVEKFRVASLPQEILASEYHVSSIRKALTDVGRPGMSFDWYPQSKIAATHIAVLNTEWGVRPSDIMRAMGNFQLTIEYNWLSVAFACQNYGCHLRTWAGSTMEFAGGLENSVVCAVAGGLLSYVVFGARGPGGLGSVISSVAAYGGGGFIMDPRLEAWSGQIINIVRDKYCHVPFSYLVFSPYEPNHPLRWLYLAISTMRIVSGGGHPVCYRTGVPKRPNLLTPLEVQLVAEVAKACVKNKISQSDVGEIARRLVPKPPSPLSLPTHKQYPHLKGKPFEELYDLTKFIPEPKEEHLQSYEKAKKKIEEAGLPID